MLIKITLSIALLAMFTIGLISCSDDSSTTNNISTDVVMPSKVITGKLMRKKYDALNETYTMIAWDLGASKIKFSYSVTEDIATADLAADGSFSVTLPAKLSSEKFSSPNLLFGINSTPSNMKITTVPLIITVDYTQEGVPLSGMVKFQNFSDQTFTTIKSTYFIYGLDMDGTINGTNSFSGDTYNLKCY